MSDYYEDEWYDDDDEELADMWEQDLELLEEQLLEEDPELLDVVCIRCGWEADENRKCTNPDCPANPCYGKDCEDDSIPK